MIERVEGIAVWRQISEELRAEIQAGRWPAETKLPPEAEFAARFGVNRHTVRRALGVLVAEGLVRTDQGRGTFVRASSRKLVYPIARRTRFSEIVDRQARAPAGQLLAHAVEPAPAWLAAHLDLAEGTGMVRLETLQVADSIPISVATSWFPAARFPHLIETYAATGSVSKALARDGLADYARASTTISARIADAEEAALLALSPGTPVLDVVSVNVDDAGRPFQLTRARFAADRVDIQVIT
jgi:GntR family phosphonate transport system transcriptional regulator